MAATCADVLNTSSCCLEVACQVTNLMMTAGCAFSVSVLQLLLVMGVLEHTSVFLLLCWVLVVPLLLGVTRVADVARKRWLLPLDGKQLPCMAVAAAGLGEQGVTGTYAAAMLSSIRCCSSRGFD